MTKQDQIKLGCYPLSCCISFFGRNSGLRASHPSFCAVALVSLVHRFFTKMQHVTVLNCIVIVQVRLTCKTYRIGRERLEKGSLYFLLHSCFFLQDKDI